MKWWFRIMLLEPEVIKGDDLRVFSWFNCEHISAVCDNRGLSNFSLLSLEFWTLIISHMVHAQYIFRGTCLYGNKEDIWLFLSQFKTMTHGKKCSHLSYVYFSLIWTLMKHGHRIKAVSMPVLFRWDGECAYARLAMCRKTCTPPGLSFVKHKLAS